MWTRVWALLCWRVTRTPQHFVMLGSYIINVKACPWSSRPWSVARIWMKSIFGGNWQTYPWLYCLATNYWRHRIIHSNLGTSVAFRNVSLQFISMLIDVSKRGWTLLCKLRIPLKITDFDTFSLKAYEIWVQNKLKICFRLLLFTEPLPKLHLWPHLQLGTKY